MTIHIWSTFSSIIQLNMNTLSGTNMNRIFGTALAAAAAAVDMSFCKQHPSQCFTGVNLIKFQMQLNNSRTIFPNNHCTADETSYNKKLI